MELSEKVRLEIGVSDHFVKPTVDAIIASARTGDVGDGKIFVVPVEKVVALQSVRPPAGSVPDAADLVVSDPVQAGTMAVMAIADTARFSLNRQRGRRY